MSTIPLAQLIVVDDEVAQMKALCNTLKDEGYIVCGFSSPNEALAAFRTKTFDLVLTDLMMPEMDGIAFLREAQSIDPDIAGILMTGHGTIDSAVEAMKAGALDYIQKPFKLSAILPVLSRALAVRRLRMENIQLRGTVAIYELSMAMAFALDFDTVLQKAADAAFHQCEGGAVSILLPVGDGSEFAVAVTRGEGAERRLGRRVALGNKVDDWLARYREMLSGSSSSHDPAAVAGPALHDLEGDLTIPMLAGGKLIGILSASSGLDSVAVSSNRPRTLGQIKALNILASAAASAMEATKKKELEVQFLRHQRLESIGALAGGIAHDLNNALAPILMAVRILQLERDDEESQRVLSIIESSAQRGSDMVKQVLTFARGIDGKRGPVQPKHLVKEMQTIIKQTFPKSIQFQSRLAHGTWTVIGDPTQLHQVLLNLCVNARDAMPNGGTLTLKIENIILGQDFTRTQANAKLGPHILISVKDTGTGIAPGILDRIFEPFFTTKPLEKGTGLGLSTVQTIVKSHGGFVTVVSELGAGTEFKIYLPAEPVEAKEPAEVRRPVLPTGHGELILIVDDEAAIGTIAKETLLSFGYRVLVAHDGAEAVALCAQHKDDLKLMLTDMGMPVMDGLATILAARTVDSQLRIIIASGLTVPPNIADLDKLGVQAFLNKPFTAEQLVRSVHLALQRPFAET